MAVQQTAEEYRAEIKALTDRLDILENDHVKISEMKKTIEDLEGKMQNLKDYKEFGNDKGPKDLTDYRTFQNIPMLGGPGGVDWTEFEFKLQSFLRPLESFEKWLDWIKKQDVSRKTRCKSTSTTTCHMILLWHGATISYSAF